MSIVDTPSTTEQVNLAHASKSLGVSALLCGCGYLDYITGFDLSLIALYAIPVALAVWLLGLAAGMASALASTFVWAASDLAAGHVYAHGWVLLVNAFNHLMFFLLCVYVAQHWLNAVRTAPHRTAISECSLCHRVRLGRHSWVTDASYIERDVDASRVRYQKVCPDCARKLYASAGYRHQSPAS